MTSTEPTNSSSANAPGHMQHSESHEAILNSLEHMVGKKSKHDSSPNDSAKLENHDAEHNAITPAKHAGDQHKAFWKKLLPSEAHVDELFAEDHMGNFVVVRSSGQKIFESMPLYVRLGMSLMLKSDIVALHAVDKKMTDLSKHQGQMYDDESNPQAVLEHIQAFVKTYEINTDELLEPDLKKYTSFNKFFYRSLKEGARPVSDPQDNSLVSSAADCRLTVFSSIEEAQKIWIKGKKFSVASLLGDEHAASTNFPAGSSIAIFRLAPCDYHHWASPVGPAVAGPIKHIDGELYTVNPQAVNQNFNVFTRNKREVMLSTWNPTSSSSSSQSHTVATVAVGAMLVGSIAWLPDASSQGTTVQRGQDQGYFAYGGSTVIALFGPEAKIQWDDDLVKNSQSGVETVVRVGERIGKSMAA